MNTESTYPVDLITSYFAGEATSDDVVFLSEWLKADPKHEEFFHTYRKTWETLEKEKIDSTVDVEKEWNLLKEKTDIFSSPAHKTATKDAVIVPLYSRKIFRMAAVLLLLVIPALFLYLFLSKPGEKTLTAGKTYIEGQLPDGSSVTLNSGATLEYPSRFKGNARDVRLSGEAFFEVAHDRAKPFIISASNIKIKVLGTSFYVNTSDADGNMEVILSSGKVEIYYEDNSSEKIILAPGEKANIAADKHEISKSVNEDQNFLSWKTRKMIFSNDPLPEVISMINKVYHSKMRLANPELENCLLTATFDNQTLESVLKVLEAIYDLKITKSGEWIVVSGRGCK